MNHKNLLNKYFHYFSFTRNAHFVASQFSSIILKLARGRAAALKSIAQFQIAHKWQLLPTKNNGIRLKELKLLKTFIIIVCLNRWFCFFLLFFVQFNQKYSSFVINIKEKIQINNFFVFFILHFIYCIECDIPSYTLPIFFVFI